MEVADKCVSCGHPGFPLHANPKDGGLYNLCFGCLDAQFPEIVNRYPGWREREALAKARADRARINLHR